MTYSVLLYEPGMIDKMPPIDCELFKNQFAADKSARYWFNAGYDVEVKGTLDNVRIYTIENSKHFIDAAGCVRFISQHPVGELVYDPAPARKAKRDADDAEAAARIVLGPINAAPTWVGLLPILVTAANDDSDAAYDELRRMAAAADAWNAHCRETGN